MADQHNDGKHIEFIINKTRCDEHKSQPGVPCWALEGDQAGNFVIGVCGDRIKEAGYVGKISEQSTRKSTGGRFAGAKRT